MSRSQLSIIIVLLGALVIGSLSVYTVDERQKAILFRLGKIIIEDMRNPASHTEM